jgi:hypothetical protein
MMKYVFFSSLLALAFVPLSVSEASATNYSIAFCFQYETEFFDADGGDYWTDDEPKTARGIRARITRVSDGAWIYDGYTNSDTGCTSTLSLSSTHSYRITVWGNAQLYNGNQIKLYNNNDYPLIPLKVLDWDFTPNYSGQPVYVWEDTDNKHIPQIAAAAGYAINKRYAGLTNQIFQMFYDDSSSPCTPACTWDEGDIFLEKNAPTVRKFVITHEMGHAVAIRRDENLRTGPEYDESFLDCAEYLWAADRAHDFASREYASTAAVEGFAHYYAASVWNNGGENDCSFYYYKTVDFEPRDYYWNDPNRHVWVADPNPIYSCATSRTFLEGWCYPWDGYGVESDWLTFWWDIQTQMGLTFGQISDIYDCANAHDWTWNTDVYYNLRECVDANIRDEWDYWANENGINH